MYQALCNEPWCWTPEQVGRLTDYQVRELIVGPAVRRAKGKGGGEAAAPRPRKRRKSRLPTKEEYVAMGERFGFTPEQAAAEYDRVMGG